MKEKNPGPDALNQGFYFYNSPSKVNFPTPKNSRKICYNPNPTNSYTFNIDVIILQ